MDRAQELVTAAFAPIQGRVAGVLLYGSHAVGSVHENSDIDVCIVAGDKLPPDEALRLALSRADMGAARFDVRVFEELPWRLRGEILDHGRVVLARDPAALAEYLRSFGKVWDGMRSRNAPTDDDIRRILAARKARP